MGSKASLGSHLSVQAFCGHSIGSRETLVSTARFPGLQHLVVGHNGQVLRQEQQCRNVQAVRRLAIEHDVVSKVCILKYLLMYIYIHIHMPYMCLYPAFTNHSQLSEEMVTKCLQLHWHSMEEDPFCLAWHQLHPYAALLVLRYI